LVEVVNEYTTLGNSLKNTWQGILSGAFLWVILREIRFRMSSYKNLNLNRALIDDVIKQHVADKAEINLKKVDERITYSIPFHDNKVKTALLLVYYVGDGTTTLLYGSGKNQIYSQELADKIKEKANVTLLDVSNLYFKSISSDNFDLLIQFLPEIGASIEEQKKIATGKQYILKGEQGEKLSFIYYNNNSILFQGRPSFLFNKMMDILVEIFPPNDVLTEHLGYYKISTPKEDFLTELETIYPNCFNKLSDKLKAILVPSIALKRVSFEGLEDYSFIAYPSLRCLEGVMKAIYLEHGEIINNKEGFKDCFKFNHTKNTWEVDERTMHCITCDTTHGYLIKMYTTYCNTRNSLFHVDALTPKTTTQEEAISITEDVLNILEDFCVSIKE
jgi:hypothetical protein